MMPPKEGLTTRTAAACRNCRERKVKCSGGAPCKDCFRQRKECFYPPTLRRRKRKDKEVTDVTSADGNGVSLMDSLLHVTTAEEHSGAFCNSPRLSQFGSSQARTRPHTSPETESEQPRPRQSINTLSDDLPTLFRTVEPPLSLKAPFNPASLHSVRLPAHHRLGSQSLFPYQIHSATEISNVDRQEEVLIDGPVEGAGTSTAPFQKIVWEEHDPWPSLSICSPAGLKWVCERTRSTDFMDSVNSPINGWSPCSTVVRAQDSDSNRLEVDESLAWTYVTAYFDYSYHTIFGVLDRSAFESQLRTHFQSDSSKTVDASWHALRNVVYATGCRSLLARDPSFSFGQAQAQAWHYFKNALSVFTELLFGSSSLCAIQALTLMTFFLEGLGSPTLEYVMCANAVRMAQARRLHRQPPESQGLQECDILNRGWLWWTVYCLEKQIAFRSGRPSAIVDDDITTQIPTTAAPGSSCDVELFTFIIKNAQISSQVSRRLMSVMAFQQPTNDIIKTVADLHKQLQRLLDSLPSGLKVDTPVRGPQYFQMRPRLVYTLYLHFAIYGSLIAIHVLFFYPWMPAPFCSETTTSAFRTQVARSSSTIANAARKIILIVRAITIDAASPAWLAIYYPMYAHRHLFVYILKSPTLASARSDVVLLDICAGHFGNTEFVTSSEVSFILPRDSATIASKAVKAAKVKEPEIGTRASMAKAGCHLGMEITQNLHNEVGGSGAASVDDEMPFHILYEVNQTGVDFDDSNTAAFEAFQR